jgi:hypothetical protein
MADLGAVEKKLKNISLEEEQKAKSQTGKAECRGAKEKKSPRSKEQEDKDEKEAADCVDLITDDTNVLTNQMSPYSMILFRGDYALLVRMVERVQVQDWQRIESK